VRALFEYVVFRCVSGYGGYASGNEVWVYSSLDADGDGLPDSSDSDPTNRDTDAPDFNIDWVQTQQ
jgi:hypothetical protein